MKFFTTRSGAMYAIHTLTYLDSMMGVELITGYSVTRFIAAGDKIVPTFCERVDSYVLEGGHLKLIKDHEVWGESTTVETVGAGV